MPRRFAALLLLLTCLAAQANGPRVLACDDRNEWPPYTYRVPTAAGQAEKLGERLDGFSVALLRRVAERAGWQLRIELLPWKRCVEAVRSGEMQLALNAIVTAERERDFWLSPVLYETRLMALWSRERHPDGFPFALDDAALARLRVGGVHGYSYSQLSPARAAALERAPHYDSLMQMLHAGRIDIGLVNEGVLQGQVARGHASLRQRQRYGVAPLADHQPSRFHFLFTRARPEGQRLQQQFEAEWLQLQKNGELQRLRERYLGPTE